MAAPSQQARTQLNRATLGRVAQLFLPYKREVSLTLGAVLVAVIMGLVPPFLLKIIIDEGLSQKHYDLVGRYALLTMALVLGAAAMTLVYGWLGAIVGQKIMCDLRSRLFTHLQGMSLRFFTNSRTGDIQTRLISDVGGVQTVVSSTLTDALSNIAIFVSALVAMFVMDWRLTLVSISLTPFFMVIGNWVGEFARKVRKGSQEQTSELNSTMQENLSVSGALLAKTAGRTDIIAAKFERENKELAAWQVKTVLLQYAFFGMIRMITQVLPAVVYWVASILLNRGDTHITIGLLAAFTGLQIRMFFPLTGLMSLQVELLSSVALFERIFEYLDMPHDIQEKPGAVSLPRSAVKGSVAFEDVSFTYEPGSTDHTLQGISFRAEPGQLVALVGPSGAGKTTMTYLIPRLYDADGGRVLIDGHDVRDLKLEDVSQIVGAVTQETYLLHTSIRENLRVAKPDASDEELERACRAAAIYDHIASLPEGFDTVVGERGYKLSGGEKQRISIARAILKNPPILILDEATSALDTQSERAIQNSLDSLMTGRTTFAIAHRLSTIVHADLILVMQDGRIVERGKHEDLLAQGGVYRGLYEHQFGTQAATVS